MQPTSLELLCLLMVGTALNESMQMLRPCQLLKFGHLRNSCETHCVLIEGLLPLAATPPLRSSEERKKAQLRDEPRRAN